MKLLDVIKRAILEGKLDTELGITDCDVMQRFDKVMELVDKPIQLPRFELPAINKSNDNFYKDYHEKFGYKVWSSTQHRPFELSSKIFPDIKEDGTIEVIN